MLEIGLYRWKFQFNLSNKNAIESNSHYIEMNFTYQRVIKVFHSFDNPWKTLYKCAHIVWFVGKQDLGAI